MGQCIDKVAHSCGTTQGLQVYANEETGKVDGYCWSCCMYVPNPYGEPKTIDDVEMPKKKTAAEIQEEMFEIMDLPAHDVPYRKLRKADLEKFNVKVGLSEQDGKTPVAMYFPMTKDDALVGYYCKTSAGQIWSVGEVKDADPFGWEIAKRTSAYRIYVTEGLEDAVAALKIFATHGKEEYQPAVISLPNGSNSVQALNNIADDLKNKFREVVFIFDDDKAGHSALAKAMMIIPSALSVKLPEKDANDCVKEGCMKAAFTAMSFEAAKPKNTRIVYGRDIMAAAREPTPWGELTWPWPTLEDMMRGIRYGETIYLGAGPKMGKSEVVNALAAHFTVKHDVKVFMAKPEESNKKTWRLICGKFAGKIFHDPKVEFDYEAYDAAGAILKDKVMMIDLYQHMGWQSLREDIMWAVNDGAKVVIIDPITNLTNGMSSSEANVVLQAIAEELSAMALDLNIVVFLFCHLKSPDGNISKEGREKRYNNGEYTSLGNCPHGLGGDVISDQFAGSRAMMRSCNLMLGLEGNKDFNLPENIRNQRFIRILEDREFGNSDKIGLYWNKNTTQFKEM
jgi:twinkle protein